MRLKKKHPVLLKLPLFLSVETPNQDYIHSFWKLLTFGKKKILLHTICANLTEFFEKPQTIQISFFTNMENWMAISGYRLPQQLQNNSSSNNASTNHNNQQAMNDLLNKTNQLTNIGQNNRDNSNTSVNNSDSATSTMLDMWAASKLEAASNNSNSSSNLGGNGGGHQAPTTPPISAPPHTERSVIGVPGISAPGSVGPGNGNHQTPGGHISASSHDRSGSISTPGSIKGLHFIIII